MATKSTSKTQHHRNPATDRPAAPPAQQPAGQPINMTTQQVQQAAMAGVELFKLKTTLWPGDLRRQLAVLEVVLQGIAGGNLVVVTPQQLAVESKPNHGGGSH